ncbi:MAG: hypothetical protein GX757_08800 [Clostridiales bacterium]|nr:hypothetical protein [Clostridiales bacterium]
MKRFLATLLSGLILASSIPAVGFADVADDVASDIMPVEVMPISLDIPRGTGEPTAEDMEKALLAVKSKIEIPDEYSEFSYYFYDGYMFSDEAWSFVWSTPDGNSRINVNCDKNYRITYYYKYSYTDKPSGIAKFLKSELKSKADDFIVKIAPELKKKYEFVSSDYESIYSGNYVYKYQRKENGVAFPDNSIKVSVNSITGEVTAASINWLYDKTLPSGAATVTKEEAAKIIKENMKMELVYKSDNIGIYDKSGNRKTKAYLVYQPSQSYISVDAKSGKVYNESYEWIYNSRATEGAKDQASMEVNGAGAPVTLTEKEIAKIRELHELISKDKAIEIVTSNKSLYLDPNLKSINASLSKIDKADGKSSYVWYISMNDPRKIDYTNEKEDYYRAYAHAAVDAKSGKLISFYASLKTYFNDKDKKWESVEIKYNKDQAREILEKLLKSEINSKFKNSKLSNSFDDYVLYYNDLKKPVYGGYSFSYNRTNEGVEYPYNYIYGSVDGVSGKIYNFGYYWNDYIEFESTKGVISPEQAMDYYLNNKGFDLKYEIKIINKLDESKDIIYSDAYRMDYEIRLVYRPDVNPMYISPHTGEQLNYDGTVYKEKLPYSYSDITDPVKYRNIFLLADMGLGFEGDSFQPEKAITVGEFNQLLSNIGYGYYNKDEDSQAAKTISREEAAMTFISRLGLEKISKLSGIYKTGYDDEASIKSDYIGAVAIAKALGLMEADSMNKFNPKKELSRMEAVNLIINYINLQQSGLLY